MKRQAAKWEKIFEIIYLKGLISETYKKTYMTQCGLVTKSCPTLEATWTVAHQAPLSMGFPRQEYWSGLPFPSPVLLNSKRQTI